MCVYALDVYPKENEQVAWILYGNFNCLQWKDGMDIRGKYAYKETCIDGEKKKVKRIFIVLSSEILFPFKQSHGKERKALV